MKVEIIGGTIFVNGRQAFDVSCIVSISCATTSAGTEYLTGINRNQGAFEIKGGKTFGGSPQDWWVTFKAPAYAESEDTIGAASLREAVSIANNM